MGVTTPLTPPPPHPQQVGAMLTFHSACYSSCQHNDKQETVSSLLTLLRFCLLFDILSNTVQCFFLSFFYFDSFGGYAFDWRSVIGFYLNIISYPGLLALLGARLTSTYDT